MNLLIDIGNTRAKYVIETKGTLSQVYHCEHEQLLTVCKQQQNLKQILLVSVSNQCFVVTLKEWATSKQVTFLQVTTEKQRFGIKNSYIDPQSMGTDKWLALIGAQAIFPNKTILIVDSGTATTIDILNNKKQHVGGWIIPGVDMMMTSLYTNTDKVKGDFQQVSSLALGNNTSDNVNFGCWASTLGAIEQAQSLANQENILIDEVVFTGGNGKSLLELGSIEGVFIDSLIFVGLQQYL